MRTFGLIGYPLSHSFSKTYFINKFKNEGITDAEYFNFEIDTIKKLPEIIQKNIHLKGLSVTSPYKSDIIQYLNCIDEEAKQIGAVNAVKIDRSEDKIFLTGYNTDVFGFEKSLRFLLNKSIKTALIIGTGGAANAVGFALQKLNISYSFITRKRNADSDYIHFEALTRDMIKDHKLIINATPVGMFPQTDIKPEILYDAISKDHILYDLIYNPPETQFLIEGKKQGAHIMNGKEMLKLQAEKAWYIFNS